MCTLSYFPPLSSCPESWRRISSVGMAEPRGGKKEKRKRGQEKGGDQDRKKRKFRGKRVEESQEIKALEARIRSGAPPSGSNPLALNLPNDVGIALGEIGDVFEPYTGAKNFEQLPLSDRTKRGLKDSKFVRMTAIQRASLPHSLCGRDVLGAAKTGSGKTLAFLIPVIEKLYRLRWGTLDGVGAIIISPTRELAYQIFDELKKVGKHHSLSGGLLIGGRKDVETEKEHVSGLNILVCTPGRLLQHMDETANFDCTQLQILVLDEADRILDLGFSSALNAIVAQLPKNRQTLLFSATQTRSVQDLARLSLHDAEYLSVHADSAAATPARLQQTAMLVKLDEKLDMLWSFVKSHLHAKTLVFLSSCKQVKFVYEAFKRLHPGVPVKCLHGRMKQTQRMLVFYSFCETRHSLLFSTDVAARGLDFPTVDWVVQVDCPEDVASYIHRVGRTARYTAVGRSLLFLSPSEQSMLSLLEAAKVPIKVIKPNSTKIQPVSGALSGLLSKDPDLKYLAQRAFVTYLRSIHLHSNKDVFDVTKLPYEEYAASLGLPTTPRVRFIKQAAARGKGKDKVLGKSDGEETGLAGVRSGNEGKLGETEHVGMVKNDLKVSKLDRLFHRKNADVLSSKHEELRLLDDPVIHSQQLLSEDEEEFLKKKIAKDVHEMGEVEKVNLSKMSGVKVLKKKKLKIAADRTGSQRLVFDEDGNAMLPLAAWAQENSGGDKSCANGISQGMEDAAEEHFKRVKEEMKKRDKEDRLLQKQRLRDKRLKQKQKTRSVPDEESQGGESSSSYRDVNDSEAEEEGLGKQERDSWQSSEEDDLSNIDMELKAKKSELLKGLKIRRNSDHKNPIDDLSLADQETLALKLLSGKGEH